MPDILDSKFKKHPMLLWRILNDTEACYIYEHKKEPPKKDGDYSSYNCHGCAKEWLWPYGDKSAYLLHVRHLGSRTNNPIEGYHTRVGHLLINDCLSIKDMLMLSKDEFDDVKSQIDLIKNGTLPQRARTKQEEIGQDKVANLIFTFSNLFGPISYADCCDFLDNLAHFVRPQKHRMLFES